jgi:hypothetical protein
MGTKTKILTWLILMAIIDTVIPFPVIGFLLVYVILSKPAWFRTYVRDIYGES